MTPKTKKEIGGRLRAQREHSGYTREQLGELCNLSPRFLANVELGDATFSMDSLMTVCKVLSCSADKLLFGAGATETEWDDTVSRIRHLDVVYKPPVDKVIQGIIEITNRK